MDSKKKKNHEKPNLGYLISGLRLEPRTYNIQSRGDNFSTSTFGRYDITDRTARNIRRVAVKLMIIF